jgi:hypothetical protein
MGITHLFKQCCILESFIRNSNEYVCLFAGNTLWKFIRVEKNDKMDKREAGAVMKYSIYRIRHDTKRIPRRYAGVSPSYSIIKRRVADFMRRREITDESRSRRPKMSDNSNQVKTIHIIILGDRRLSVRQFSRRQFWLKSFCSDWRLRYEQAVCKMDTQNVDARPETCQIGNFRGTTDSVQADRVDFFRPLGWDLYPGFTTLNQNPSYKSNNGNTSIIHLPKKSNRLPWSKSHGLCFLEQ